VRFTEHVDTHEVGPGNYDTDKDIKATGSGGLFGHAQRFQRQNKFRKIVPGPAKYTVRKLGKKKSQKKIKFAPVFGSTSKRFTPLRPDSNPCIGMYKPPKSDFRNKYKNKRKIKISFD
jgi:hypothetical protein